MSDRRAEIDTDEVKRVTRQIIDIDNDIIKDIKHFASVVEEANTAVQGKNPPITNVNSHVEELVSKMREAQKTVENLEASLSAYTGLNDEVVAAAGEL